ncbi:zinc-binding alcohol dehydrogenase [Nocardioides endophyticus]|uniref:zinc-dependent alcohol dehydrogenase n=1 Tax=Nocardioides endophyticus TaxID=1353775 RepID=UPI0031EC8C80
MTSHTATASAGFTPTGRATATGTATAYWLREPGRGELRAERLSPPGPDEVLVRTLRSGVSRGTELLVHRGGVPVDQRAAMRAPFQVGEFPGPVKYGYLSVGVVEEGPTALRGRTVFCLHPHQTAYVVPASAVTVVPDDVPHRRAVLAGTVETAINALWDLAPLVGDRVAVVGAGMVGCAVARLLAQVPGVEVTLVDVDPDRATVAIALGARFAVPGEAPRACDSVVHTSGTGSGLRLALGLLAPEGEVLELSWYGDELVQLPLGGVFHSGRLAVRASQVGRIPSGRRRSTSDRMALALRLLADPAYDALLTGESDFADLPAVIAALASGELPALCHTIRYAEEA